MNEALIKANFHLTKTYLRCKCCEYEISHCDKCEIRFEDDQDIYCTKDEHLCEDCYMEFEDQQELNSE